MWMGRRSNTLLTALDMVFILNRRSDFIFSSNVRLNGVRG